MKTLPKKKGFRNLEKKQKHEDNQEVNGTKEIETRKRAKAAANVIKELTTV